MIGRSQRHLPASHPVRRRAQALAELHTRLEEDAGRTLEVGVLASSEQTARIEDLATRVVLLPEIALSGQQRRSLLVIARELYRRAAI